MPTAEDVLLERLKERLHIKPDQQPVTIGRVLSYSDGIAKLSGLPAAEYGELLEIETHGGGKARALALNLERELIGAIVLDQQQPVAAGDVVVGTGKPVALQVSDEFLGRVISPLGDPLDGKAKPGGKTLMPLERIAPGVISRESVRQPLSTGILAIDALVPIGRGQRELIIGDRGTGKTAIALDTILNQTDVVCIYVAIGQKASTVRRLVAELERRGALGHTIVVAATAAESAALQYLAPYAGAAIGEYFMAQGKDALVVYDDLSKHAWAYRELSLLLRRPPGREAYPGDVFYLHSRLLERAAKLNKDHGGGSLTALPIIETQAGDVSTYIPTNVISITDGQIYLETDLFYQGVRPAVSAGLSVSRVGGTAQKKSMKTVAGPLRLALAQFRELQAFAQFGSDLDEATKQQLARGQQVMEVLKQAQFSPLQVEEQVALLQVVTSGLMDHVPLEKIGEVKVNFLSRLHTLDKSVLAELREAEKIDEELAKKLKRVWLAVAPMPTETEKPPHA